jgi:uncharacterized protein (DUF2236 family)
VSPISPFERAASLGGAVARAPFHLAGHMAGNVAGQVAEPARRATARRIRRAVGLSPVPPPLALDPSSAYLTPGSIARVVHGDLPSMLIGGLSALMLQMLHPLAMAGMAEHSSYREDPIGRLRRTADFVSATTFGTVDEAESAIAQVIRVHGQVRGTAPDGRAYRAGDPELVTFIHVAEMSSFIAASRHYGSTVLSPAECDRYYAEVAPVGWALGASWVPRSADEVEAYFLRMRPELNAGPQALAALNWLVHAVARRPDERAVYSLMVAAAAGILPRWARRELGLTMADPVDLLLDLTAVTPLIRGLAATVRWAVPPIR